jgi:hypothetical protein
MDELPPLTGRALKSVSHSQISAFRRCKRLWAAQKLLGLPASEAKALRVGVRTHKPIEVAYKTGTAVVHLPVVYFDAEVPRKRVEAAVANLPVPPGTPGVQVEKRFSRQQADTTLPKVNGLIDWLYTYELGKVREVDHKTTSNIEKLRANPVDMLTDPQMLIYAEVAFQEGAEVVEVAHNTISTTHVARVLPLKFVNIPRALAAENWLTLQPISREMATLALNPPESWYDIEPNFNACYDFHRECDYLPFCAAGKNFNIGVPDMAIDSNGASDLLARLQKVMVKAGEVESNSPVVDIDLETIEPFPVAFVPLLPPDAPSRETPPAPDKKKATVKAKKEDLVSLVEKLIQKLEAPVKYEFLIESLHGEDLNENTLDKFGAEGWDFNGVYGNTMVFRRAVQ